MWVFSIVRQMEEKEEMDHRLNPKQAALEEEVSIREAGEIPMPPRWVIPLLVGVVVEEWGA
jgi:hypothetical protein